MKVFLVALKRDEGEMSGRDVDLLLSKRTTMDIFGRSDGSSWTQSSPMWIRRNASSTRKSSPMFLSKNSRGFPSFQSLHICINRKYRAICYRNSPYQGLQNQNIVGVFTWLIRLLGGLRPWKPVHFFPVTISKTRTPKLYTSDFVEICP